VKIKSIVELLIPAFILNFFYKNQNMRKVAANTGWLISEQIYRLVLGLTVNVIIARYLGPEKYGIISYALSLVSFLGTFVYLGLNALVIREIVRRNDQINQILGTTFYLKLAGSISGIFITLLIAFYTHDSFGVEFWVLLIFGLSLLPRPVFQTISFWFESQIQSKNIVVSTIISLTVVSIAQGMLVFAGASVILIAVAIAAQFVIEALVLVIIYWRKGFLLKNWQPSFYEAKNLLKYSWILILAVFLELIYLKIDQIMLRWLVNANEVGLYAVAVKFSETWYFIPTALITSAFPKLLEQKKSNSAMYHLRQQQILDFLFVCGLSAAILTSIFAGRIILGLYGAAYAKSSSILVIHIWAAVFVFVGRLFHRWVFIENRLHFLVFNGCIGALINIGLNYLLIPILQGHGAAIATLVSYCCSSYLCLFIFPGTRPFAIQMSKSFIFPIRLLIYRRKIWTD
jgi:O-antigen/teichoic acid export membrane protein